MGAGDGPYLAWAMVVTLVVFAPVALLVPALGGGLTALWWAMALMMVVRMLTLGWRARSGRWLVTARRADPATRETAGQGGST